MEEGDMSIQTLRPVGAGVETNIAGQYPTSGEHWDKVDEATPDDASTYVCHNMTSYATDTYALPAGEGVGDIDKVTIVARCYGISGNYNYAKTVIRTHSTLYEGTEHNLSANWENLSTEYSTNPYSNQPWTWAEIDALEAGVALKSSSTGDFFAICTQVYVEVTYHTETPKSSSDTGSGADSSQAQANIAGADTGSGQGASDQAASLVGQENGSSVEGLSFLANLLGNELGSAIEKLGDREIVLDESNGSMEASSLGAALAATGDSGSGLDGSAGQRAAFTKAETGSGSEETLILGAALTGAETGLGVGAASLLASLLGTGETGSGLETLLSRAVASGQIGSGLDQVLARLLAASQAGSGLDNISDLWKGTEDKDMQRSDSGGGAEAVHDRVIFLPDSGAAIDALLSRSLFAREGCGHALKFDGIDDRVLIPDSPNWILGGGTGDFTIEGWFRFTAFPQDDWWKSALIAQDEGAGSVEKWFFTKDGENEPTRFHAYNFDAEPDESILFDSDAWVAVINTWYYIAIVRSGNTWTLYKDGSPNGTKTQAMTMPDVVASLAIGWGEGTGGLEGDVDQIRISNIDRTQAEITANWNGGAGRRFEKDEHTVALWHMDEGSGNTIYDETDNDNDGTIYGASWVAGFIPLLSGIDASALSAALTRAETGSGAESLLARLLATAEVGAGIEALLSRLLRHADSGLGTDARTALSALRLAQETGSGTDALIALCAWRLAQETGSGTDALIALCAWRLAHETGLGVDKLLSRGIPLFDAGSGLDAATLYKVFLSADSGAGLEALAALLALIITSEVGSGSEQLRAKIMTSAGAYDMKLPTKIGKTEIPSKGVNL